MLNTVSLTASPQQRTQLRPIWLHALKVGTHSGQNGAVTFTTADIEQIAASYDPAIHEAPAVLGHPVTDAPAYGWVRDVEARVDGLWVNVDLSPELVDLVDRQMYKNLSVSLYPPLSPLNPVPGGYYLKHLGFLGAQAPAVKGLKKVSLSEPADEVIINLSQKEVLHMHGMTTPNENLKAHIWTDEKPLELAEEPRPASASLDEFVQTHLIKWIPKGFIGTSLFPIVKLKTRSGKVFKFGADDAELITTVRTPGASIAKTQPNHKLTPFHFDLHAFAELLPLEVMVPDSGVLDGGIDYDKLAIISAFRKMMLRLEYDAAQLARAADRYSSDNKVLLSGTSQWSHADSSPTTTIRTARQTIRSKIGFYPNIAALSDKAFSALQIHPDFSHVEAVTPAFLAALWNIERVVVGDAVYKEPSGMVDIWGGDVVLAYTVLDEFPDLMDSSYGCTHRLISYPQAELGFDHKTNSNTYFLHDTRRLVMSNADAGFLIQNAVT